ncbi:hypothetical protein [Bradyrhizobium sp. Ash2021]|uniref:hypothetical protein n=1 Tax=Bradyrhizobium sp. Ash2021 TaxID=2954771 RepID=UPI002815610D|nr:hypothetical protein [Bradyrhizobium sp. Ash2021]WMT72534.1 hypothetical protein NL528_31530 [Bradyrhizobium sp. Ash2021]
MRRSAIMVLCAVLGACSSINEAAKEPVPAPDASKAVPIIKTVAGQYHLTGQLEIAGPIEAPIASSIPWVICLRSASAPRQTYALFYKKDEYVSSRISTIGDRCDSQVYEPLPK